MKFATSPIRDSIQPGITLEEFEETAKDPRSMLGLNNAQSHLTKEIKELKEEREGHQQDNDGQQYGK